MGRRKGQIAMMGNSILVKNQKQRKGHRGNGDSFLHTTELDDGTTYNRINFQSVTEQSNLEDFLNTAEMAGKDFTAERQNIQIITNPGEGKKLTEADMEEISQAQYTHRSLLQIPRRPHWDETTTKEELAMRERDSFTDWRRQLKLLEEKEHIQLTPYEKNLDFWRQLWRVIERSDVVVQIVDARNPLLFRCEDLETYVKQVDPNKTVMLLVNKADYLTNHQRQLWVDFFNMNGIRVVFFSAMTEKEKMEKMSEEQSSGDDSDKDIDEAEDSDDDDDEEEEEDDDDDNEEEEEDDDNVSDVDDADKTRDESAADRLCANALGSLSVTDGTDGSIVASEENETSVRLKDEQCHTCGDTDSKTSEQRTSPDDQLAQSTTRSSVSIENHTDIVSAEQLLQIFRQLAQPACSARSRKDSGDEEKAVKTVGMVGYPNVGKSSTINVILQEKKLAVSATPGRTKHLQTLYVDKDLMLCDCPGLVFPSFVATKAHLVTNGILPIDELRDHVSPTNLVCDNIPRSVLEATYSIMIPRPSVDDTSDRVPTAEELLFAYGGMRGFMTPRGVDAPRASRYILKDYVKGKLLYCEPPPGISGADFQDKERILKIREHRPVAKIPPPQVKSAIDQEFFAKRQGKAHSRGKHGVADHVRVDTLTASARVSEAPQDLGESSGVAGSMSSLASANTTSGVTKSWKKHNNRNKKEKLRRLHRDLDVY